MALTRGKEALLNLEIKQAEKNATSELAKYVFNPENYKIFKTLISTKTPTVLLKELNEKKISDEQIQQFKTVTSHHDVYKTLFELPPEQWFSILMEEKTSGEDLVSLIANDYMGAFSGVLDSTLELPNKETCVKALFFLKSSPHADAKQIKTFLNTIQYPRASQESFIALHPIFHNTVVEQKAGGFLVSKRPATEVFLRIDANHADAEQARVHAALRIMRECINYHHDKVLFSLPQEIQKEIKAEELIIKKTQEKIASEKKNTNSSEERPSLLPLLFFNQEAELLRLMQAHHEIPSFVVAFPNSQANYFTLIDELINFSLDEKRHSQLSQVRIAPDIKSVAARSSFFLPTSNNNDDNLDKELQKAIELSFGQRKKEENDLKEAIALSIAEAKKKQGP